jgi:hypothetical protein
MSPHSTYGRVRQANNHFSKPVFALRVPNKIANIH